jgi:hypothetical protein
VVGEAHPEPDPALKARWVARHPYAAFYAEFTDFALFRLRPANGQFIGGFASAHRLKQADLEADPAAVAAVGAAEAGIIEHMNTDHAAAIAHMAGEAGWRMVAVDVDGCDLGREDGAREDGAREEGAREEGVRRVDWSAPVADAAGVRAELIRLART